MMDATTPPEAAVRALAERYCEAVWYARAEVFEEMCHERFQMTHIGPDGPTYWDKDSFLARVRGRAPAEGPAPYHIFSIDVAGGEIARAHLWVDVPTARFEDHLGFVKLDGQWRLLTKVFRTMDGPAQEA